MIQSFYVQSFYFCNNDIILQSEGGRGSKKAKKLRSYLMYGPLVAIPVALTAASVVRIGGPVRLSFPGASLLVGAAGSRVYH